MLFLQFVQYSIRHPLLLLQKMSARSCPGTMPVKNWAVLTRHSQIQHEDNAFTLNCYMVPRTFLLIFHAGSRRLRSNNYRNSSYKEKSAGSARVSRLFPFLMTMNKWIERASTCLTILTGIKCSNKWIYKNRISAASDFCAHNQLKFHNSIAS